VSGKDEAHEGYETEGGGEEGEDTFIRKCACRCHCGRLEVERGRLETCSCSIYAKSHGGS